jgi:hypothetical protein
MGSETGIADGGMDPVLALRHGCVRKAYDDDTGVTMPGVDFNLDGIGVDPVNRPAVDLG